MEQMRKRFEEWCVKHGFYGEDERGKTFADSDYEAFLNAQAGVSKPVEAI